ncbi:MAG: hypothetical protein KAR21_06705, partial [Spirochaetales bacterium]|nr:hypothetical protein [Spirochaetales bacterium]
MNRKLTIVLVIMAIIPIGLLSWMGFAGIQSEKESRERQTQYIGYQRLEIVKENINLIVKELEDELDRVLKLVPDGADTDIDEIRNLQRNHNLVKQIFITDKNGLIYPSMGIPLSGKEKTFLSGIKETDISFYFLQKSETENPGETLQKGWHTWFMG